jgi:hypothetical protein
MNNKKIQFSIFQEFVSEKKFAGIYCIDNRIKINLTKLLFGPASELSGKISTMNPGWLVSVL